MPGGRDPRDGTGTGSPAGTGEKYPGKSIRELSEEEKKEQGIQALPENLSVALFEMEQDPWVEETLGASFLEHYKKGKRKEWKSYMKQVSEWELAQYLYQI